MLSQGNDYVVLSILEMAQSVPPSVLLPEVSDVDLLLSLIEVCAVSDIALSLVLGQIGKLMPLVTGAFNSSMTELVAVAIRTTRLASCHYLGTATCYLS